MLINKISTLPTEQVSQRIQQDRGFIPIDVEHDAGSYSIVWLNVGDYQFTESKFRYSIQHLTAPQPTETSQKTKMEPEIVRTPLDLLTSDQLLADTLYPSGFIFHMSRCGSTLFAKSLARVPQHIVIDEGTPLNDGLWHYLTAGWQQPVVETHENATLLRNMVLALGRRRTSVQETYFVKFRSWNVIFIDFIQRVFPDVPCVFIYRDPAEVLVSAFMRPVWILDLKGLPPGAFLAGTAVEESEQMSKLEYLTAFYGRYLESALAARNIQYLNYEQIQAENMAPILQRALNYHATSAMLDQMNVQFSYYSKDDSDTVHFSSDVEDKRRAITPEIRRAVAQDLQGYYEELNGSPWNLKQWV